MHRREFLFASAGILSGCALPPNIDATFAPQQPKDCCASLAEATYLPYDLDRDLRFVFDEATPSFAFPSGRSKFAGVQLKAPSERLILESTTLELGFFRSVLSIFVPTWQFLDGNFRVLSTVEPQLYQNTGKLGDARPGVFYSATFVPENSRYIVLFTDVSKLGNRVVLIWGGDSGSAGIEAIRARQAYSRIDRLQYAVGLVKPFGITAVFGVPEAVPRVQDAADVRFRVTSRTSDLHRPRAGISTGPLA